MSCGVTLKRLTFSLFTWVRCSRNVFCVCYVGPPVVIETLLLLTCVDPQVGRLWDSTINTVCKLLCRYWSHKMEFALAVFTLCWYFPVDILSLMLIWSYSVVVWNWPLGVLVLSLFRVTPVRAISDTACQTLGNLFGAISDSQLIATSAESECVQNTLSCAARLLSAPALRTGQQRSQNTQKSSSTFRLPVELSHWKTLRLYPSAKHKLHRTEWRNSNRWGYCFLQVNTAWRAMFCLRKLASAVWENDSA